MPKNLFLTYQADPGDRHFLNTKIDLYTELEYMYADGGATGGDTQPFMPDGIGSKEVMGAPPTNVAPIELPTGLTFHPGSSSGSTPMSIGGTHTTGATLGYRLQRRSSPQEFAKGVIEEMCNFNQIKAVKKGNTSELLQAITSMIGVEYKGHKFSEDECSFFKMKMAQGTPQAREDFLERASKWRGMWLHHFVYYEMPNLL